MGEICSPCNIYFLEAALQGDYVKYLSNVSFDVTQNQPGIDLDNLHIMSEFRHWSYIISQEQILVCDLQGVGTIVTDPQIIDLDQS